MTQPWENLTVTCPGCGTTFPLASGLGRQAHELLVAEEREALRVKVRAEVAPQLVELRERLEDREAALAEQRRREVELRRRQRELDERQEAQDVALERMRDEVLREAKKQAAESASRQYEAKLHEREEALRRTNARLAELERETKRDARQSEGVAAQQVFGERLQERFPDDDVTVTRRGQAGADVLQIVRTAAGHVCGQILWECKRTSRWDAKWLAKLGDDRDDARADLAVIVSDVLPRDVDGSAQLGNAWVCDFASVWHVAPLLRAILVQVAAYRAADAARGDVAGRVFDYIATGDFASRLRQSAESVVSMQTALDREKRSMQQVWSERQRRIDHALEGMASMVGDLIGLGAPVPAAARAELLPPKGGVAALPGAR